MTTTPASPRRKKALARPVRWILDGVGLVAFGMGVIGIFVPGWPTTVFWIITVLCFLKTRPAAVRPMLRTPIVGPAIRWFLRWKPFKKKRPKAEAQARSPADQSAAP